MKLAIISHTEHIVESNGKIKGWGPTIREINFLATKFDEIYHIACISENAETPSSIYYEMPNIHFLSIPATGGKFLTDKIKVVSNAPHVIHQINSIIDQVDAIQLRVPTGIANYLLPWLTLKHKKPLIWVKYAGNWGQENAPLGYQFQKWWLINNFLKCKVTINGKWKGQPQHCFTFENPCLDKEEREAGKIAINRKNYSGALTACFIGRIEKEKGVERILDAAQILKDKNIRYIHFIGDGAGRKYFENKAQSIANIKLIFHGNLSRKAIPVLLEQSHLLLLPSTASEGFPKVIAEGANYGAVPVVSNISSIGQYINSKNGYVWDHKTSFINWCEQLELIPAELKHKSENAYRFAEDFTFDSYFIKLNKYILDDR